MSGVCPQSESFEDLAMPLFDQLHNFAHWLTWNRVLVVPAGGLFLGMNVSHLAQHLLHRARTGLRDTSTVPLDSEEDGSELAGFAKGEGPASSRAALNLRSSRRR